MQATGASRAGLWGTWSSYNGNSVVLGPLYLRIEDFRSWLTLVKLMSRQNLGQLVWPQMVAHL